MSMIYLWTTGKGWEQFDSSIVDELKKRGIRIGDGARIGHGARIGDGARIGNGARPIIIYIIGSKHPISYWGEDRIDIGCYSRSIKLRSDQGRGIGEKEGYSADEIDEYSRYIEIIAKVHAGKKEEVKS